MQLRARDALDEGMGGPGALLELQLTPLDFQVVPAPIQGLELHEQRARAVLAVDRTGGRAERRHPQQRQRRATAARRPLHGSFSATRSSALRARGLRATSASPGRALAADELQARPRLQRHHRQARERRIDLRRARCMKCLTGAILERVEADHGEAPAGASTSSAAARPRSSWPSSSLMYMRSAWKVRVAGCLPGSRVRTAPATSAASSAVRVSGPLLRARSRSPAPRGARSALRRGSRSPGESRRRPPERARPRPAHRASGPCACRADRRRGS